METKYVVNKIKMIVAVEVEVLALQQEFVNWQLIYQLVAKTLIKHQIYQVY